MRHIYVVHYGDCTSSSSFGTWSEAARFIKHCLDGGTRIRAVTKEQKA